MALPNVLRYALSGTQLRNGGQMAQIGARHLARFCRRVGTSLRAGVDTQKILSQESQRGPSGLRQRLADISNNVAAGYSLAEAFRETGGYFPELFCELIEVGEESGRLDQVLLQLADHYDHMLALRRQFLLGIIWPAIQLGVAVVVIGLLILILGIITGGGREPTSVLGLSGSSGAVIYFSTVFVVGILVTLVVVGITRGWFGSLPMRIALWIPGLSGCLRTMALARVAWTLSTSLDSGVDARKSMRLALRSSQNPYYTAHIDDVDQVILSGREFNEALRETGAFPEEFLDSLAAAELSGTHAESMLHLAKDYQERAQAASKLLTNIAAFGVWALVATILVAMIFYMFFNLYYKHINDALQGF